MDQMLTYICGELNGHGRDLRKMEILLRRSRSFNLIAGIIIFALVCKLSRIETRVAALEAEGESVIDA